MPCPVQWPISQSPARSRRVVPRGRAASPGQALQMGAADGATMRGVPTRALQANLSGRLRFADLADHVGGTSTPRGAVSERPDAAADKRP